MSRQILSRMNFRGLESQMKKDEFGEESLTN